MNKWTTDTRKSPNYVNCLMAWGTVSYWACGYHSSKLQYLSTSKFSSKTMCTTTIGNTNTIVLFALCTSESINTIILNLYFVCLSSVLACPTSQLYRSCVCTVGLGQNRTSDSRSLVFESEPCGVLPRDDLRSPSERTKQGIVSRCSLQNGGKFR